jgi:hypothetical protein
VTAITFLSHLVVTLPSAVAQGALVAACLGGTGLAWAAWSRVTAALSAQARARVFRQAAVPAALAGLGAVLGVRVERLAYAPGDGLLTRAWDLGALVAVDAAVAALVFAVVAAWCARRRTPVGGEDEGDVERAVRALGPLREAVGRLRASHAEARAQLAAAADPAGAEAYGRAAGVMGRKLELAEELEAAAVASVLRERCRAPVRTLLRSRPDHVVEQSAAGDATRVSAAACAVESFLGRVDAALATVVRERDAAPGSLAARLGVEGGAQAEPALAVLQDLRGAYGRVHASLQATALGLKAEGEAQAAVQAASRLGGGSPMAASKETAEVASGMVGAESLARLGWERLDGDAGRGEAALARATAVLQDEDEDHLREVLRALRDDLAP